MSGPSRAPRSSRRRETVALMVPARRACASRRGVLAALPRQSGPEAGATARGELIVMAPAGSESDVGTRADARLGTGPTPTDRACFDSSAGFTLRTGRSAPRTPPGSSRSLDAVTPASEKFAPICPDFVVESRRHRTPEGSAKMRIPRPGTCSAGCSTRAEVEIYRPVAGRGLERRDALGEDVCPASCST